HIDIAINAGADAIGFVFARSVRQISIENALLISKDLPEHVMRVAVLLHPNKEDWNKIAQQFKPDAVQTDAADFDYLMVPTSIEKWPVYREHQYGILPPKNKKFIYEGQKSGHGECVDWRKAATFSSLGKLILAGGLSHENISEAIEIVQPFGVDVSSAVESEPGKKDSDKIKAFISNAKKCG
ncbi:MAG: phosphoribosylanthranilate isomerase, partial [Woeseiaceae bacterium]|nr:phosphoribosylanthranilate isomerase [Woeseiaceae bacterium]